MENIDNKTLICLGVGTVTIGGLVFFLHKKNANLAAEVEELKKIIESQNQMLQAHEQILRRMIGQPPPPQQTPLRPQQTPLQQAPPPQQTPLQQAPPPQQTPLRPQKVSLPPQPQQVSQQHSQTRTTECSIVEQVVPLDDDDETVMESEQYNAELSKELEQIEKDNQESEIL